MTTDEMKAVFEKEGEVEFLKFDRVKEKRSARTDLHAFILIDAIVPGERDIIGGAAHDQIWLSVDLDDLAKSITDDQVIELIRCGVMLDDDSEGLSMFV